MSSRKNILFLHHVSCLGGAESVLLTIAQNLDRQHYHPFLFTQDEGPLTERFRKVPGEVACLPLPAWRKGRNIFRRYQTIQQLIKMIKERDIDLIHCHQYRLAPYLWGMMSACAVPGILHLHDPLQAEGAKKFGVTKIPNLVCVSDFVRQALGEAGRQAQVIYNGIELERFSQAHPTLLREEFQLPQEALLIGMIANFTDNKRQGLFIEIAKEVNNLAPSCRFIIVGHDAWNTGISQTILQQKVQAKGLQGKVIFTGWRNDTPGILKALDAIVVPSIVESFPLIVLEAMASGAVVFAQRDAGGPAEQITDGKDGFLVDCTKTAECARRIMETLNNRDVRARVAMAAVQTIRDKFLQAQFIKNIEKYYGALLFSTKETSLKSDLARAERSQTS
jgi:glycosyltransferase involved in cell wall biosynthesis